MQIAGLDIGTTGCKISVFQDNGTFLGSVYRDYAVQRTRSEHEVDAAAIWDAVQGVLREATGRYSDIGGIGVTSFGETFVLLDDNDKPLCPSMLYTDPRGGEQCARLTEKLGERFMIETTGLKPHAMYSISKLMWIKENRPEVYAAIRRVMLMEDYIVYMLTGQAQIDYSLASRTMAFDIRALTWNKMIFDAAGINPAWFSTPVPVGTSAGTVKVAKASSWGLNASAIVVSVSHDQVAAAVGSGVFDENYTVDGAGTVECMTPVFTKYDAVSMSNSGYAVVPYVTPGAYVCYAFTYTGGALVKWFVDHLAGYAAQAAKEKGVRVYSELEDGWNGQPTGLLVLPHFAGAATPYMDSGSKGAILGLTLAHTQQDIHLAIMEGVCYEMRLNMERLAKAGVPIRHLRATGGGANSRVWLQMKADILGIPVTALQSNEAGAAGSAMLVGVAAGLFANLQQAATAIVAERETYYPRQDNADQYIAVYERYKHVYDAVRPLV